MKLTWTIRLSMLSSTTSLMACTGRRWPSRWIRSIASVNKFRFGSSFDETKHTIFNLQLKSFVKKETWSARSVLTAGFHQLSMRYTRDASVKFRATPPAFKLTRKTVTSILFTVDGESALKSERIKGVDRTEVFDGGISSLGWHRSF